MVAGKSDIDIVLMNGRKRPVAEFGEGTPQINKTVANTSVAGLRYGVLLRPRLTAVSEVGRADQAVVTINLVMHLTPELLRQSF